MYKIMIVSLVVAMMGAGLISAQQQDCSQGFTTTAQQPETSFAGITLAEIAARGEVTVAYADAAEKSNFTASLLAELSAQGAVTVILLNPLCSA
jgi:hypothetical protein